MGPEVVGPWVRTWQVNICESFILGTAKSHPHSFLPQHQAKLLDERSLNLSLPKPVTHTTLSISGSASAPMLMRLLWIREISLERCEQRVNRLNMIVVLTLFRSTCLFSLSTLRSGTFPGTSPVSSESFVHTIVSLLSTSSTSYGTPQLLVCLVTAELLPKTGTTPCGSSSTHAMTLRSAQSTSLLRFSFAPHLFYR